MSWGGVSPFPISAEGPGWLRGPEETGKGSLLLVWHPPTPHSPSVSVPRALRPSASQPLGLPGRVELEGEAPEGGFR